MNNKKLIQPAYPLPIAQGSDGLMYDTSDYSRGTGFTKQEKAALMMAAALVGKYNLKSPEDQDIIAKLANELAASVLEEANR